MSHRFFDAMGAAATAAIVLVLVCVPVAGQQKEWTPSRTA